MQVAHAAALLSRSCRAYVCPRCWLVGGLVGRRAVGFIRLYIIPVGLVFGGGFLGMM